jgi:hypothetical protein
MNDDNQSTQQTNTPSSPQHHWQPLDKPGSFVSHHAGKPPKPHRKWWPPRLPQTKKGWIIFSIVVALLIGAGVASYFIWFKADPQPVTQVKKVEKPKETPKPLTSTLTGMPIADASVNDRPVTAIMIENSPDARPQSGIDQAGVVFEAVAEGGITRFLTLYQDTEPGYIGPVRSVRPYYVQWLAGFDAAVAHVGGSAQALQDIKTLGIKDLDQFHNPSAYHRISGRYAPHNMYTSIAKLRDIETKKGFGKANYSGFARKAEGKSATPNATSIDFAISGALYNAHFDYIAETNSYNRSVGGKAHMVVDEAGVQKQLQPKTVVALVMPKGNAGIYSTYNTIGEGQAYIFQDGVATVGTWHKSDTKANFTFTDPNGAPLALNPGQTWLTALGSPSSVTYK